MRSKTISIFSLVIIISMLAFAKTSHSEKKYPMISLGIGLPGASINLGTKDIGFLDANAMVMMQFSPKAYQGVTDEDSLYSYWSFAIGFIMQKPEQDDNIRFGVTVVPYIFRYEQYSFGVGINWVSLEGKAGFQTQNFSIAIPISYSFNF